MDYNLMQYKDACILFIEGNNIIAYDKDAKLLEYLSSFKCYKNSIKINFKYINNIVNILKNRHINYIILDAEIDNKEYDGYISEYNNYEKYISKSSKYNNIRKVYINILNFIFFVRKRI